MNSTQRIHFLDFSRSVAILMMLQGHFISMTLESYPFFMDQVRQTGSSGSIAFSIWGFFRGLTAPLFFTISGTVFTFLLHKEWQKNLVPFFKLNRVQKGLKRAASLLLIGYLLQVNLKYIPYYFRGHFNPHFLGFHILQCIGFGLMLLLVATFLISNLKKYSWLIYLLISAAIFSITPLIRLHVGFFPEWAPQIIQNMIKGPETGFSIFPWIGYIFLGAGFGHYITIFGTGTAFKNIYRFLFLIASSFYLVGWVLTFIYSDNYIDFHYRYLWAFDRTLFISLMLLCFTSISQFERWRHPYFMAVGQETFTIYIVHAIILYGAITGFSLRSFLENKLSATEAIFGAMLFLAFFIVLVQLLEPIRQFFRNLRSILKAHGNS